MRGQVGPTPPLCAVCRRAATPRSDYGDGQCAVPGCLIAVRIPPSGAPRLCNPHNLKQREYGLAPPDLALADAVEECQSCGVTLTAGGLTKRCIDHNHGSLHVRGVICMACNCAEGYLRDREHGRRLFAYLDRTDDPSFDWAADRRNWLSGP